jgi:hypothetical protein
MGVFDLVGVAAKGAKKAAPFFSKADVVLDELPRTKGLGNEFLGELVKKGAKPTELRERGIEKALKDKPKMTKAEVQKIFEEKAAPKVQEKVLSSDVPDYDEWLENKAQEIYGVDWFDLRKDEQSRLNKMYGDLELTQYDRYKTPGGENYREILLKLPSFDSKRLMELEADIRRSEGAYKDPMSMPDFRAKVEELAQLKEQQAAAGTPYTSSHYRNDPNLLAHIRVQDFISPTYTKQQAEDIGKRIAQGMGVSNPKNLGSGSISVAINRGYVTPKEAAQYADFREFRGEDTTGARQKVLLVDEIQSDWHQEGRTKGYASKDVEQELKASEERMAQRGKEIRQISSRMAALNDSQLDEFNALATERQRLNDLQAKEMDWGNSIYDAQRAGVPDAPFKKNWHELAMKRVLDYAAENGYDSVAITPGAEQAKRYDLSKQISKVQYDPNEQTLYAYDKNGREVISERGVEPHQLEDYIGKEPAEKLRLEADNATSTLNEYDVVRDPESGKYGLYLYGEPSYDYGGEQLLFDSKSDARDHLRSMIDEGISSNPPTISGLDLTVGGEGMKGFYDKILPDYLNNYGKKYGASVVDMDMITQPERFDFAKPYAAFRETIPAESMRVHSFEITPQMREEITTKGQPMYGKVAMPALEGLAAGSGAATIGSQVFDENNEQTVQNPVHFTENPDAMLLELMQRN